MDQVLTVAQEAEDNGRLPPERYEAFLKQFRESLEKARTATPPSPTATALYARILARLDDSYQALDALEPALRRNPTDPELVVALGHVRFQQHDYAAALAAAEAVLEREPKNQAARGGRRLAAPRFAPSDPPAVAPSCRRRPPRHFHRGVRHPPLQAGLRI